MLGMLTHFLWLWMFVWSFICCFHMFRVFTANTVGINATRWCCSQSSSLLYTVLLSLACPVCIVSLVITISLATSGGKRTGYGKDFCYLDSTFLVGVATVFPLALVILTNVIFFIITAGKIHKIGKLQSPEFAQKNDRTNLYIYIKLSTITGAFWVIQILAEALNNDVLRFIAIFSNGLQGVFIFLSYMCNKRILNIYCESISKRKARVSSSDTPPKVTGELIEMNSCRGSSINNRAQAVAPKISSSDKTTCLATD
ncbi:G-protein coupled receptor Mth [Elysia marginata]|uniref:G-protein coupled receptor Mth n=1 Tax=Elysia marginata TaxID=1093978 RepID=A0AAV4HAG1_9GAST|nr:G-protein coupled receptor Mth [Elysia marginata]